jgi:hypothetical protein
MQSPILMVKALRLAMMVLTYRLGLTRVVVATLALGSRPRQKLARGAGQKECERVWGWRLTPSSELPFWELESWWTPELSKSNCRSQKLHIEEFFIGFESYWSVDVQMGSHDPFEHLQHKLWQKERPRVKLAVWLPTMKCWESTRLLCVQVACDTPLKSSWREL